ncbi:MAG: acetylxylan esterase [Pirellulales bacterium]|nr:acetylxylan esterase [Pirellulales bacterium]
MIQLKPRYVRSRAHYNRRCTLALRSFLGSLLMAGMTSLAWLGFAGISFAQTRITSEGELPPDDRLAPLRDLNGYFPFSPVEDVADWPQRADDVRTRILVSQGLWPKPEKTPLNEQIYGKIDGGDFTVEKVHFESWPGFFVTGSLYRPKNGEPQHPAVLCPHGHWTDARFLDKGEANAKSEIEDGAEFIMNNARNHIQARCVQLARMGCVVFQYDMIGHSDSRQIAHRPGVREHMIDTENWGLFSPQAELRLQNMMGLQTWNSVRAVDFVSSLPDVDVSRIGVTGASGGGTQSMILSAIDPRITVSMPAVMVSTAMQGGCTCENACYLRIGTGNVEFAALFAPKPLGLTSADDWTKEFSSKGMPELRRHFALLNAEDNVMLSEHLHFGHNYNAVSRAAMYRWFNQHLQLGLAESQMKERDHEFLTKQQLTVWDEDHPAPPEGEDFERSLLAGMTTAADKQLRGMTPGNLKQLADYQETIGRGWQVLLGAAEIPLAEDVSLDPTEIQAEEGHHRVLGFLKNTVTGGANPVELLMPMNWNEQVVIWVSGQGRESLYSAPGVLRVEVQDMLDAGVGIFSMDLFMQGEFITDKTPQPVVNRVNARGDNANRVYAGYTYGYNHPLFAQRTQDVLAAVSYLVHHERAPKAVHLAGIEGAGAIVLAARAIAGKHVKLAAVDLHGFQFANINTLNHADFLPGAVKYGDVSGLMALNAPHRLWVIDERLRSPTVAISAYRLSSAPAALTKADDHQRQNERSGQAVQWLLRNVK